MKDLDITTYNFFEKLSLLSWVDEIWLYGSRARGDNQERSDMDLAIVCPKASQSQWFQITDIVEDADTLLEIDCVRLDELAKNSALRKCILRDKKILFSRNCA